MNDLKVIIDVGARDTTYPEDYPEAICHLFEPNPDHLEKLKTKYSNWPVIINDYGISDRDETLSYNNQFESFVIGDTEDRVLKVKTLDPYIKKHKIENIDLLKVDAEAMDYLILKGNPLAVKRSRYIIFEDWDNIDKFRELLGKDFYIVELGQRNYLCKRKLLNSAN